MYNPREISIKKDFNIQQKIDPGKVQIIVLDGNQGTAHVLDDLVHGKTVIQTVKGSFARGDHEIGFKMNDSLLKRHFKSGFVVK
ncbi:XtrA/YqaO family protein [Bacillus siamensis]|uniref:XtrA/YqaO family protein n=1 Tax=Bacillus siamensis TaxID=659243 RepID=UPI002E1DE6C8|nr:XtrA/YqaO family protein [Bacillus siamensis]MED5098105.1 XtrA/YqaO family protein [Bacillus siamensis]